MYVLLVVSTTSQIFAKIGKKQAIVVMVKDVNSFMIGMIKSFNLRRLIFLRGDYKSGWELEREWEEEQKKKRERAFYGADSDEDSKDNEYFVGSDDDTSLPFACLKCRGPFVSPVSTRLVEVLPYFNLLGVPIIFVNLVQLNITRKIHAALSVKNLLAVNST